MKGVISVGANLGQEVEGWMSLGIKDFILFEPVKTTFERLERIMSNKGANIILFNMALGNTNGTIWMNVETCHQGKSSSILEPFLHLTQYPDIEFTAKEQVKINKLDNIFYNRRKYNQLHVDTQGYELEVLRGAEDSLRFIDRITIEVYRKELYKGCPMYEEVSQHLFDRDFHLVEVFWKGMSWGDATFER